MHDSSEGHENLRDFYDRFKSDPNQANIRPNNRQMPGLGSHFWTTVRYASSNIASCRYN